MADQYPDNSLDSDSSSDYSFNLDNSTDLDLEEINQSVKEFMLVRQRRGLFTNKTSSKRYTYS